MPKHKPQSKGEPNEHDSTAGALGVKNPEGKLSVENPDRKLGIGNPNAKECSPTEFIQIAKGLSFSRKERDALKALYGNALECPLYLDNTVG